MSSIVQTIQKRTTLLPSKQSLPISSPDDNQPGLRRRLSSLSLKIQPNIISSSPASWAISRSKSLSDLGHTAGTSIKTWWAWGWAWILSRKPTFAQDLEMNEEEKHLLGFHNKGSMMHIFYKIKSEVRKLFRHNDMSLPQTFKYNN